MVVVNKDHIFHILPRKHWGVAEKRGVYECASLAIEGFIHCSLKGQVCRVANFIFKGQKDLLLLEIDPLRLRAPLRFEGGCQEGAEKFPHIYGALNLNAVVDVHEFPEDESGEFFLPKALVRGGCL